MYKFYQTVSLAALTLGLAWPTLPTPAYATNVNGQLDIVPASQFIAPTILRPAPCFSEAQCAFQPFDTLRDLAFASVPVAAQPAVAKDTLLPSGPVSFIHQARFANDGNYGNGSSWISNSPDSWLKIDLGRVQPLNRILIGRDRLGFFDDRDPGHFTIEVANKDTRYLNGNDDYDHLEYRQVFDSAAAALSGQVDGSDTLEISIPTVNARFVKLTFADAGIAIDEVEVRAP